MPVDLHTHSTASDGSDPPARLVARAAELGLGTIALTDHDTLEGIPEAAAAAALAGIGFVPGVELSLAWDAGTMHLVVLWLDPAPGPLQDRLAELQRGRSARNERMLERLAALGIEITPEELAAEAGGGSVGRPHLAAILVRRGVVADIAGAFDAYLARGRPAYVDRVRLTPEEAIGLARRSGAVPVLAHPHTLGVENRAEMAAVLDRLVAAGMVGIECHYGGYDADGRAGMVALAGRFGLVAAGGSDYHGTYKPDVALGTGRVGLWVPDSVLGELAATRVPS